MPKNVAIIFFKLYKNIIKNDICLIKFKFHNATYSNTREMHPLYPSNRPLHMYYLLPPPMKIDIPVTNI